MKRFEGKNVLVTGGNSVGSVWKPHSRLRKKARASY